MSVAPSTCSPAGRRPSCRPQDLAFVPGLPHVAASELSRAASVPLLGDDDLQDVELGSGGSDVAARTRNFLAHAMRTRRETVVPVEQGQSDGGGDTAE